jgi:two-component system NarL family sensor kinase
MLDIRRLVEGLRPPVLDQLGLVGAVRAHADALSSHADGSEGLVLTVQGSAVEPLPAAVEVAAYRVVLEAMTNVARHASASACHVRLWRDSQGPLMVEVEDDGHGLPERYKGGVGLNSMRERATELGGAFSIEPGASQGTVVRVRLPIPVDLEGQQTTNPTSPPSDVDSAG